MTTTNKVSNSIANEIYNCKDGTYFNVFYTYKYGSEPWETCNHSISIYADSVDDAIERFFLGDETQGIEKKDDNYCNRVVDIIAYAR